MSTIKYDYRKLKGRIREVFGTQALYAAEIGMSAVSVSNKLNNLVDWKQIEIEKSVDCLRISPSEIHIYFFTKEVEGNLTEACHYD